MTRARPDLTPLAESILRERGDRVSFTADEIEAQVAQLRAGFERIRIAAPERRRVAALLGRLPAERVAGWLDGVKGAVKVVVGEARRSSHILAEAARGLLPSEPDSWFFAPVAAGVTRGDVVTTRVESQSEGVTRSILVDDGGLERRVMATIRGFPAGEARPVLLIAASEATADLVLEVDAEVISESDGLGAHTLRYEAFLPPGTYDIFFGNPRRTEP